ncbi:MAG: hypothetical protein M3394_01050 [Actinomycetota bacterium]|nr:hypothetical protein [Actinomycetota bacterium]MDQ3787858.1 hypothetical protein [Actinomycetota bacterium]
MPLVDLRATVERDGPTAAVVELMRSWWHVDVMAPSDELALIDVLCTSVALKQLPWPQEELVVPSLVPSTGELVIGLENQRLWEARIDPAETMPVVRFFVDDGRRRLGPTMGLGEFFFRVLVEAAAYADPQRIRCRVLDPEAIRPHVIADELHLELGTVRFSRLVAGAGWFGVAGPDLACLATQGSPRELVDHLARFGEGWKQRVGPGSGDLGRNPWEAWPTGAGERWRDLK